MNRQTLTASLLAISASVTLAGALPGVAQARHSSHKHATHHKKAKHHTSRIPQRNGGDHDPDNNGASSDGDGNV